MPVLTQRDSETISLAEVGITVQVLSTVGNCVRIALHVPDNVDLLRETFPRDAAISPEARCCTRVLSRQEFHDLKNQLHAIRLTLHLIRRQQAAGKLDAAATTTDRLWTQVEALQEAISSRNFPVDLQISPDAGDVHWQMTARQIENGPSAFLPTANRTGEH